MIRKATINDTDELSRLLKQVQQIHYEGRPDIFKNGSQKYSLTDLKDITSNDNTPVYVYVDSDGCISAYAFCMIINTDNSNTLKKRTTIYIDDLCVDLLKRGQGIGTQLFEFVKNIALQNNYSGITLNVWNFNTSAMEFYKKMGMTPLKTTMEFSI